MEAAMLDVAMLPRCQSQKQLGHDVELKTELARNSYRWRNFALKSDVMTHLQK